MNSLQIERLLYEDPITKKYFGGVYSRDNLPIAEKDQNYYVVNCDPSYEEGSHWIAMYIAKNGKKSEYYDSFGLEPQHEEFKSYLGVNYICNDVQIQHPFSSVCGQHVIFYIVQRCNGLNLKQIQDIFKYTPPEKYLLHDIIVNTAVERYFNIDLHIFDFEYLREQLGDIDINHLPIDKNGKLLTTHHSKRQRGKAQKK